jgi:hypothetical protein
MKILLRCFDIAACVGQIKVNCRWLSGGDACGVIYFLRRAARVAVPPAGIFMQE